MCEFPSWRECTDEDIEKYHLPIHWSESHGHTVISKIYPGSLNGVPISYTNLHKYDVGEGFNIKITDNPSLHQHSAARF